MKSPNCFAGHRPCEGVLASAAILVDRLRRRGLSASHVFPYAAPVIPRKVQKGLRKAGVRTAARHLFFCIGPDCCKPQDGELLWDYVKKRLKDTGLPVMRTKAGCFRICSGGPWLVVYPEGTWYGAITPVRFDRILEQHLSRGEPVQEWVVVQNELRGAVLRPSLPRPTRNSRRRSTRAV